MISLEKWKILTSLQNLPRNVGDLGKLIVAKGFKKLPKVQKIAKSDHTDTRFMTPGLQNSDVVLASHIVLDPEHQ